MTETTVLHEKHTISPGPVGLTDRPLNRKAPTTRRKLSDAVAAERERIMGILAGSGYLPENMYPAIVWHLALETDTPVEVALGIIRKALG